MGGVKIRPEIRMTLRLGEDDLKAIVADYIEKEGYEIDGEVSFDIKTRCVGYGPGEHEEKYLEGAHANVKKKE